MNRRASRLLGLLLPAMTATPAMAQQAVVDTAKLFVPNASEVEQYLRSTVGWPTFQQGKAGELFYRFDPDGYARFGPSDRLDEDYWEVSCKSEPLDCTGIRGPVRLAVGKDSRLTLSVNDVPPDARFHLDDPDGPDATLADITKPERIADLLSADSLIRAGGSETLAIDGLETAAVYVRWVEAGQDDRLAFGAVPRQPFTPPAKPAPSIQAKAGAGPPAKAGPAPAAAQPPKQTVAATKTPVPKATTQPKAEALSATGAAASVLTAATPPASGAGAAAPDVSVTVPARAEEDTQRSSEPRPQQTQSRQTRLAAAPAAAPDDPLPVPGSNAACAPARMAPGKLQKPLDSLRGLKSIYVVTSYLLEPPALKGKLRKEVEAAIKQRFEAAGLTLVSEKDVAKVPGRPQLELYLTPGDAAKGCVFRVWMSLRQEVVLVRDTSIHLLTGTWGDGGVARPGGEASAELATFTYYIDRFIKDYQTANGLAPEPANKGAPAAREAAADSGDQADLVFAVQTLLRDQGYDPGVVDGQMGQRTRAAIQTFERDNDLPVTGLPGRSVLERLLAKRPEGPT